MGRELIQFPVQKISGSVLAWKGATALTDESALEYACESIRPVGTQADSSPAQRDFTADRYGGYGVGYCGGSARCGNLADVQVKGIGLTPLIGARPGEPIDPWHSSGTVTMNEAGREAIWSGICEFALPLGALPTYAVVLTGTRCLRTDGAPGIEVFNRRALIMRAVALRPGHFMRNVHFKTPLILSAGVCEDVLRVRQMIANLPVALAQAYGTEVVGTTATARINQGLMAMARRFAAQVAAAFAKRLYHGSLNCTNIALDGRYLDFGTMTTINAYRRQASSPLWPDQWSQHTQLLRTLTYLRFQVSKYSACPDGGALVTAAELASEFNAALSQRSQIELLKQTGIPEHVITACTPSDRSRAYRCFKAIYSRGADTSFVWRGDDDPSMVGVQPLNSLGRYDLNLTLGQAAQCMNAAQLHTTAHSLVDDAALAQEFCAVHNLLTEEYLRAHPGLDGTVARLYLAREASRRNADVAHLTREALDTAMAVFEEDPDGLGAYIDCTIQSARQIMCDVPPPLFALNDQPLEGVATQLQALQQMPIQDTMRVVGALRGASTDATTLSPPEAVCATA